MNFDPDLNRTWWALRAVFGVVPIVAGLDKFLNLLTNWEAYLAPWIPGLVGFSPEAFMRVVGVIEIAAGILVLSPFTRIAAYVVMAWLLAIAGSLLVQGRYLDVAARDVTMAVAALALARLTEARQRALSTTPVAVPHLRTSSGHVA